jgi:hypothetical protein
VPSPLPPEPDLPVLHTRTYAVRSYRKAEDLVLLRATVQDQKPAGLYIDDDDEPLTIHHMLVELVVRYPELRIEEATVTFGTHPHGTCPGIASHYGELVGLSVARGFGNKVRELFGGPRGCTHVNAALQAMAPVAIQTTWSMQPPGAAARDRGGERSEDDIKAAMRHNLNTCHVWAEDGEQVQELLAGGEIEQPLWATERLVSLGRDPRAWRDRA